jgi:hypothetical protein
MLNEDELQKILIEGLQLPMKGSIAQVILVILESLGAEGLDRLLNGYPLTCKQHDAVEWAKRAHEESKSSYELPAFVPPVQPITRGQRGKKTLPPARS